VQSKTLTKLIGFLAFVALVAGATVAAWDYESTSSSRRGASWERIWHGVLAMVGQEDDATGDMIWLGRALGLLAVALFVLYLVRRLRAARPEGTTPGGQQYAPHQQYAPEQQYATQQYPAQQPQQQNAPQQYAPQQQYVPQPQAQWSGDAAPTPPQPAPTSAQSAPPPVPAPSWGAVTSGPTPLPVVPPPAEEKPDPSATRQVIIPPLPPGWGRG
jgi:hypothetical protein